MKKTFNILCAIALAGLALSACRKDFLEKPLSNDVTIDTIFSTGAKAKTLLWSTYNECVPTGFWTDWGHENNGGPLYATMLLSCSDEAESNLDWAASNLINQGSWSPASPVVDNFGYHYKGIRKANIFIENIDKVPDLSDLEKAQLKAEAKFLKAMRHFEVFKRYGGIPIVDKVLVSTENVKIPRSTVQETVNYIVGLCDEAINDLPPTYGSEDRGRATKGAALALKARTLLYAASPLLNTNTPYMSDVDANLISMGNYDAERWRTAANAAKAVLDWAAQNNCHLIENTASPYSAYNDAITLNDNAEIILANKAYGKFDGWWSSVVGQMMLPSPIYDGWGGISITLNYAKFYAKADGTEQTWPDNGTLAEYQAKAAEMEPRFKQSIWCPTTTWNAEMGAPFAPVTYGVGYFKKFFTRTEWSGTFLNWTVFRLAEFYLSYAEALNEVSPNDDEAYKALNAIRKRAGLPEILKSNPAYDSQEELRQAIRRERNVELAFEEHRYYDVRRWKIAGDEGVMKGQMYGYQLDNATSTFTKWAFETRVWEDKMYLYPFPQEEINKKYLIQNPGW